VDTKPSQLRIAAKLAVAGVVTSAAAHVLVLLATGPLGTEVLIVITGTLLGILGYLIGSGFLLAAAIFGCVHLRQTYGRRRPWF